MERFVTLLLLSLVPWVLEAKLTYIAIRLPLQGERAAPGAPWPLPKTWLNDSERFILDLTKFQFISSMQSCDIVMSACDRYHKILNLEQQASSPGPEKIVTSLHVVVEDMSCPGYPSPDMDESYNLTVSTSPRLSCATVWGALRGLETFSQLIYKEEDGTSLFINKTTIIDEPRFRYRGVMLDTARHFLPMSILLKNLDAMAYNKFNVLHWHIVDDQSFPYESIVFPSLSAKGAYSGKHVYTQEDIRHVIQFARLRGIRVVPEFDTPGHTQSWGKAFKSLLTPCWVDGKEGVAKPMSHGAYEIFDPSRDSTFDFLQKFIGEVVDVFPDQYLHLGMDESYPACWKSSPNITAFMEEKNITTYVQLMQYYVTRVLDIVQNTNKSYVIWQDPIEEGTKGSGGCDRSAEDAYSSMAPDPAIAFVGGPCCPTLDFASPDTIVEVWRGNLTVPWQTYMSEVSKHGYKTILASCWYLNYISYGQDWKKYYQCEPLNFTGTSEEYDNVIGGEVCMFAEYIDGTNLLSRLWPRASAAAERLWSRRDVTDVESAKFRLDQQRCRMLKRGIPAQPILDGYCGDYEYGFPGSNGIYEKSEDRPRPPPAASSAAGVFPLLSIASILCLSFLL